MTPCIEHRGHTRDGYGRVFRDGKVRNRHRWTWEQANGPIPDGIKVLHRCDNRLCYRLDHLFLGTSQDNTDDMRAKGRNQEARRGEANGRAKLTESDVAEIRRCDGVPARVLAVRFGVDPGHIRRIRRGRAWA